MSELDRERDALRDGHRDWRIWYVPRVVGGVVWYARRLSALNCDSSEQLSEAIAQAGRE